MIDAVIFDMDGLLIDSEPLWETAEMEAFPALGVPLTPELKKRTTGLRSAEIVQYWYDRYPWSAPSPLLLWFVPWARPSWTVMTPQNNTANPNANMKLRMRVQCGLDSDILRM